MLAPKFGMIISPPVFGQAQIIHSIIRNIHEISSTLALRYFLPLRINKVPKQSHQSRDISSDSFFIGPESDHCLPLSVTHWLTDSLTDCCLVNLIDVTLACEDANSKLVDVVTVADEDRVGNNLLQIWSTKSLSFATFEEKKVRKWLWNSIQFNLKHWYLCCQGHR